MSVFTIDSSQDVFRLYDKGDLQEKLAQLRVDIREDLHLFGDDVLKKKLQHHEQRSQDFFEDRFLRLTASLRDSISGSIRQAAVNMARRSSSDNQSDSENEAQGENSSVRFTVPDQSRIRRGASTTGRPGHKSWGSSFNVLRSQKKKHEDSSRRLPFRPTHFMQSVCEKLTSDTEKVGSLDEASMDQSVATCPAESGKNLLSTQRSTCSSFDTTEQRRSPTASSVGTTSCSGHHDIPGVPDEEPDGLARSPACECSSVASSDVSQDVSPERHVPRESREGSHQKKTVLLTAHPRGRGRIVAASFGERESETSLAVSRPSAYSSGHSKSPLSERDVAAPDLMDDGKVRRPLVTFTVRKELGKLKRGWKSPPKAADPVPVNRRRASVRNVIKCSEFQFDEDDDVPNISDSRPRFRVSQDFGDDLRRMNTKDFTSVDTLEIEGSTWLSMTVNSTWFDLVSAALIVINAILLGVQTNYMAVNLVDEAPIPFQILDKMFTVVFAIEIVLRVCVNGNAFFWKPGWQWNVFDFVVVATQVVDEIVWLIAMTSSSTVDGNVSDLGSMRILRVLRLIRIARLMRVFHLVSELRAILISIFGSVRYLLWTLTLLLMVMYMIGVYLTQLVTDHFVGDRERLHADAVLRDLCGSLQLTMLSLFMLITGGMDWQEMSDPLMHDISPWLSFILISYVAFCVFCLMNIVTGVFVENALQNAKSDKESLLLHSALELFQQLDTDGDGMLNLCEFEQSLSSFQMQQFFEAIDVDPNEAFELFRLLDTDKSGEIDPDTFLDGCLRLRGPAKAIDLVAFIHEFAQHRAQTTERLRRMESLMREERISG